MASAKAVEQAPIESQATLAPKLNREAAKIDWSKPADAIARQIRGMYPWPGCHVRMLTANGSEAGRATLVRARSLDVAMGATSYGQITASPTGAVAAGNGTAVQIVELQPEGKRPMSLEAYGNGHQWEAGMRLESL
jgi:methionyl-tRNA formyltransferase